MGPDKRPRSINGVWLHLYEMSVGAGSRLVVAGVGEGRCGGTANGGRGIDSSRLMRVFWNYTVVIVT